MSHPVSQGSGRQTVNGVCCAAPIILSAMALTLILQGVIQYGGAIPADEGLNAHLFQVLMAIQIPLIALYALTADWSARTRSLRVLGTQLAGWLTALGAVALWQTLAA